jgi:hypothetical protein
MKELYVRTLPESERQRIKRNIERIISEILSDRYDADITVRYVKRSELQDENPASQ